MLLSFQQWVVSCVRGGLFTVIPSAELRRASIRADAITPGTNSKMSEKLPLIRKNSQVRRVLGSRGSPSGRWATPGVPVPRRSRIRWSPRYFSQAPFTRLVNFFHFYLHFLFFLFSCFTKHAIDELFFLRLVVWNTVDYLNPILD